MVLKKLSILILVLGLTSAANAALLISVGGVVDPPDTEIILTPSEEVVLDIMGDGRPTGCDFFLIPDAYGQVSGGVMLYPGNLSSIATYTYETGIVDWDWIHSIFPGAMSVVYMGFGNVPDPMPLDGKLVDEIIFHCVAPGDSVLTLVSADLTVVEDIQIIHQVPEPATICLLGLGGLLLIRQKQT